MATKNKDEMGWDVSEGETKEEKEEKIETKEENEEFDTRGQIMTNIYSIIYKIMGTTSFDAAHEIILGQLNPRPPVIRPPIYFAPYGRYLLRNLLFPPSKYRCDAVFDDFDGEYKISVDTETGIIHLIDDLEYVLGKWGTICPINEGIIFYLKHLREIWMPIYEFAEKEALEGRDIDGDTQLPKFDLKEGFKTFLELGDDYSIDANSVHIGMSVEIKHPSPHQHWRLPCTISAKNEDGTYNIKIDDRGNEKKHVLLDDIFYPTPKKTVKNLFANNPRFPKSIWRVPSDHDEYENPDPHQQRLVLPYINMGLLSSSNIRKKFIKRAAKAIKLSTPGGTIGLSEAALSSMATMMGNPFDTGAGRGKSEKAISQLLYCKEYRKSRSDAEQNVYEIRHGRWDEGHPHFESSNHLFELLYIPEPKIVVIDLEYFQRDIMQSMADHNNSPYGARLGLGSAFNGETLNEIIDGSPVTCMAYLVPEYKLKVDAQHVTQWRRGILMTSGASSGALGVRILPKFIRINLTPFEQNFENELVEIIFKKTDGEYIRKQENISNIMRAGEEATRKELSEGDGNTDSERAQAVWAAHRTSILKNLKKMGISEKQWKKEKNLKPFIFDWCVRNLRLLTGNSPGLFDQEPPLKIYHSTCLTGCSTQLGRKTEVLKQFKRWAKRRTGSLESGFCSRTCQKKISDGEKKESEWFDSKVENITDLSSELVKSKKIRGLKESIVDCVKKKFELFVFAPRIKPITARYYMQLEKNIVKAVTQPSLTAAPTPPRPEYSNFETKTNLRQSTPEILFGPRQGGRKHRTKRRRRKKRRTKRRYGKKRMTKRRRVRKRRTKKH